MLIFGAMLLTAHGHLEAVTAEAHSQTLSTPHTLTVAVSKMHAATVSVRGMPGAGSIPAPMVSAGSVITSLPSGGGGASFASSTSTSAVALLFQAIAELPSFFDPSATTPPHWSDLLQTCRALAAQHWSSWPTLRAACDWSGSINLSRDVPATLQFSSFSKPFSNAYTS